MHANQTVIAMTLQQAHDTCFASLIFQAQDFESLSNRGTAVRSLPGGASKSVLLLHFTAFTFLYSIVALYAVLRCFAAYCKEVHSRFCSLSCKFVVVLRRYISAPVLCGSTQQSCAGVHVSRNCAWHLLYTLLRICNTLLGKKEEFCML